MADLRAYQPAFTAGVLSPALHARVDLAKFATGLKQGKNLFVHPHGGASNRPGLEFVSDLHEGPVSGFGASRRLIPFQFNTEQSYVLELGNFYIRFYRDGGRILSGGSQYSIVTPYSAADALDIVYIQEADVMYLCHPLHAPRKLSRLADDNWTLSVVDFLPSIAAPTGLTAEANPGPAGDPAYNPTTYRYRVSSVSAESGEESLPSAIVTVINDLTIAGGVNRLDWTAVAGADRYVVYKEDNGVYGYIGGTGGIVFRDENITADLADTPQSGRNPFDGPGKYPRCATFIEQRLAFASTINDPQAVWLSQSASYENFGTSRPAKASDAVTFRIKARQINEIRSLLAMRGLMVLSSAAEWVVSGGSQSDAITPTAIKIDNHGYRGAAKVQPIQVGNTVLFAQNRGGVVRDFSYEFTADAYTGKDLTIMARHLFEGREIVQWAYAQAPHSIIWCVLSDGSLLSLTYMKEHDVWAWTEHESAAGALFEDVVVISEGNEDVPYFVVNRDVAGGRRRYMERLHTREMATVADGFFVDSGLTYRGAATSTISGLDHLEGLQVVALSDGNVVRNLTVTAGSVTLPNPGSVVHVGLPMVATMETLPLDLGQVRGLGTVQGRQKSVSEVTLRVEDTRGIFIGPYDGERDSTHLVEYRQRSAEAWNEAIQLYTGFIRITPPWDWNVNGSTVVKQFDPLPMTILAIAPDVTLGR